MKDLFYFALTCVIFAPAAFLLLSGNLYAEIILMAYVAILGVFMPKKIWRRILRANIRYSKLLEG